MFVILAKKSVYSYDEALPYILDNKKVIEIINDEDEYHIDGRYVNIDNYDKIVAEFWRNKEYPWPELYCDAEIYEIGKEVNVKKGNYKIRIIKKIIEVNK